ncbi:MAG: CoA pyrophosphatase [Rhodocyclaceae bacterium]|nr:CoA pyrophosphatase [Rhodocyclaceae bacterium]
MQATAIWLRACFTGAVPTQVVLESGVPEGELTPAAVLVPLVARESGITVLLTQRTAHLRDHAGQVSFPGGRSEESDPHPEATALREAAEEVGLDPRQVEILGRLPEYRTGTGFSVTPVVGLVHPPLDLKLDDFEVAEVFEPPLAFLLDRANHQRHKLEIRGALREYWAMPWQGYYIWGATAGMLVSLVDFLEQGGPPSAHPSLTGGELD